MNNYPNFMCFGNEPHKCNCQETCPNYNECEENYYEKQFSFMEEDRIKEQTSMTFYIGESGSSGRKFTNEDDFIDAIRELIDTYKNNGEEWFEIQVVND